MLNVYPLSSRSVICTATGFALSLTNLARLSLLATPDTVSSWQTVIHGRDQVTKFTRRGVTVCAVRGPSHMVLQTPSQHVVATTPSGSSYWSQVFETLWLRHHYISATISAGDVGQWATGQLADKTYTCDSVWLSTKTINQRQHAINTHLQLTAYSRDDSVQSWQIGS